MKQLVILSGKGGTGKTTVAAAFIHLLQAQAYADCDVDAPNLHLVVQQEALPEKRDFFGMPLAFIKEDLCRGCDTCRKYCRFGAILKEGNTYHVDSFACEGCGLCVAVCPVQAVDLLPHKIGELTLYQSNNKVFSTAELVMGKGASGMLVTEVKKRMKQAAPSSVELALIDGSPGIGCPVIASLAGVDTALIVAEPSVSGISDMERIIATARHFGVRVVVCVNKYDTNECNTKEIKAFCKKEELPFVGVIPYDKEALAVTNAGKSIVEVDCPAGRAIQAVFAETMKVMALDAKR